MSLNLPDVVIVLGLCFRYFMKQRFQASAVFSRQTDMPYITVLFFLLKPDLSHLWWSALVLQPITSCDPGCVYPSQSRPFIKKDALSGQTNNCYHVAEAARSVTRRDTSAAPRRKRPHDPIRPAETYLEHETHVWTRLSLLTRRRK